MLYILTSIFIGYLIGCIQPSYIISKIKKANIKELGSKNAGASNITVIFGWKYGIIVALIDILKPIISFLIIWLLFQHQLIAEFESFIYYLNAAFVVIGHIFPFYMKFNGGKGTASMIGIFFIFNWKFALVGLLLLVVLTIVTNYIVLGALAHNLFFLLYTWIEEFGYMTLIIAAFLAILFLFKHRENFIRIYKGEETGLRSVIHKKKTAS